MSMILEDSGKETEDRRRSWQERYRTLKFLAKKLAYLKIGLWDEA